MENCQYIIYSHHVNSVLSEFYTEQYKPLVEKVYLLDRAIVAILSNYNPHHYFLIILEQFYYRGRSSLTLGNNFYDLTLWTNKLFLLLN